MKIKMPLPRPTDNHNTLKHHINTMRAHVRVGDEAEIMSKYSFLRHKTPESVAKCGRIDFYRTIIIAETKQKYPFKTEKEIETIVDKEFGKIIDI